MKQESCLNTSSITSEVDMEEVLSSMNVTEDIVEEFARQLDEVVRIQDEDGSEEEDEEQDNFGYQQLPQDDDENDTMYQQLESDEEDNAEQESQAKNPFDIELDPPERLNPETSNLIKSIMSNIQLSDEATPEWAKKLPERVWLPRIKKQE